MSPFLYWKTELTKEAVSQTPHNSHLKRAAHLYFGWALSCIVNFTLTKRTQHLFFFLFLLLEAFHEISAINWPSTCPEGSRKKTSSCLIQYQICILFRSHTAVFYRIWWNLFLQHVGSSCGRNSSDGRSSASPSLSATGWGQQTCTFQTCRKENFGLYSLIDVIYYIAWPRSHPIIYTADTWKWSHQRNAYLLRA